MQGTVSGEFTFELYKANADGTAPEGSSLGSQTVTNGQSATFTVDAAGQYFLKETDWPAGVIAPNLIHTQTGTGVYVDAEGGVYYGPYTLKNDETEHPDHHQHPQHRLPDHHQGQREKRRAEAPRRDLHGHRRCERLVAKNSWRSCPKALPRWRGRGRPPPMP